MIALISGIKGFLGSHLSDILLQRGYKVAGISRDLFTDIDGLTSYIGEASPDYIFHCGAYGHQRGMDDIDQMIATNIFNTYVLLKVSSIVPLKKFVYVGTSSEYGKRERAMKESDPLLPETPYATTKAAASILTRMFKNTLVVRPFSLFGEGEKSDKLSDRFIPTIVQSLKYDSTMALDEEPRHDWIYVRDAAYAIVKAAESDLTGAVNIGSGKQYSNLEMVKMLEGISGKKLKYEKRSGLRGYDTNYWLGNISKLKSTGYTPIYGVRCGLKKTYEFY